MSRETSRKEPPTDAAAATGPPPMRRRGTVKNLVGGSGGLGRRDSKSLSESTIKATSTANVSYENTYRMAPDEEEKFIAYKVEHLMKEVLEARLKNLKYDPGQCSQLTQDLCSSIKSRTKQLKFSRYKLIVQVVVGQDTDQAVQVASRCLWNHSTDNFAAATFRNSSVYAIAIVYGLYLD